MVHQKKVYSDSGGETAPITNFSKSCVRLLKSLLTAFLDLVVEYQIALSGPVHNSEAVFSPIRCLGCRQIFAGHSCCKPVAILVNAAVGLR